MSKVRFDENNPNVMSEKKHRAFDDVITKYGFAKDPWLNENKDGTYLVIDGEQGIRQLQARKVKKFKAKIFKVSYTEVRMLRQIANKLHGKHNQKKDADEFRVIFEDKQLEEFAVFLGEPIEKFEKELELTFDDITFHEGEDDIPELPKIPKSKLGDIYQLDNHRVVCGDCTNLELREKLFEKNEPDIICTDPPYSSGGKQESGKSQGSIGIRLVDKKTGKRNIRPKIKMDDLSTRGYISLIKNTLYGLTKIDESYIFTDWRMWDWCREAIEASELPVRQMIVWDKLTPGMGIQWRGQHELICFSKRSSLGGPYHKGNVLNITRSGNVNHPTEKPIKLLTELIENTNGKTVYDPFLGSGSNIIACEELKKNCVGFELDPKFMDVIIERWEKFTGKKAKKLN